MEKTEFHKRDRLLMFAFALGPMSALTHLNISYALVPESCAQHTKVMLHALTALFVVLSLIGSAIGWYYQRAYAHSEGVLWKERTRWLAVVVNVLSIFSAVTILAMEIANVVLRSCD